MTTRTWGLSILLLFLAATAASGPGTWKNYTSMKDVRGIAREGTIYWAATSGGLYRWSSTSGDYTIFTNADGLLNINLTAITIDAAGTIWTGAADGTIHALTPSDRTVRPILDIRLANKTDKRISSLTAVRDTVLIGTEFGLSVFRISKFEFGDTYEKFGAGTSSVRFAVRGSAIFEGRLWAAITDGQTINRIAWADLSNPNLLPPESWTLETVGTGGQVPTALAIFNGTLYAGTSGGLFARTGGTWVPVGSLGSEYIAGLAVGTSLLSVTTRQGNAYTIDAPGTIMLRASGAPYTLTCASTDPNDLPLAGSSGGGILLPANGWMLRHPNGPNSNQFLNVVVDPDGVLWGVSGPTGGAGFYRYDGNEWKSFTATNSPLLNNDYHRIAVDCSGGVWISSFGRGLVEIPYRADRVDSAHLFYTNVGMVGLPNDPLYIVPSNVVCDARGNRWASIINPVNRRTLVVRTAAGAWQTLPAVINGVTVGWLVDTPVDKALAVDAFDNLWAIVREAAYRGVINFGNRGQIDSTAAVLVTSADGLPSDDIRTIVVDKENDLWVGTDKGIGIILDPENPKRQGGIAAYRPLTGLMINCIAVDALNQKWVGTSNGVVLLSADGTQVLANYTMENTASRLISNEVRSIAVDEQSGTVYFGTAVGLSSLTTTAAAPKSAFAELSIYPNPFRIPNGVPLTIDGLVANSAIKIITVDGTLVRDLRTPGGRIGFWDGKDDRGHEVASGVYMIVAYGEDGSAVANGKVAVIRK